METYYISLGMQCTVPNTLTALGVKRETLPFDWMLSSPKFVFTMLELLLVKNLDTNILVREHFFKCNKRATIGPNHIEHYVESLDDGSLYNEEYRVIFPHDEYNEETIQKYINRFNRLKDLILDETKKLIFVYISESSINQGRLTINNEIVISGVYHYLSEISKTISANRKNFRVLILDSLLIEDRSNLDCNIDLLELEPRNGLNELQPECESKILEYISKLE